MVRIDRTTYEPIAEEDESVYIVRDGIKKLVKVPNVELYSIEEGVDEVSEAAFMDCTKLVSLTVPYTVSDYELDRALEHAPNKDRMVVTVYDWPKDCRISDEMVRDIDEGYTDEQGFVYSKDRKRLLRAASKFDEYFIPEGVERIERLAFNGCRFETLHVPYTCRLDKMAAKDCPIFGSDRVAGCVTQWEKPYSKQDEITNPMCISDYEECIVKDNVRYSHNGKRLLNTTAGFDAEVFEVPEGVENICDRAFDMRLTPLTLIIPHSVKIIGKHVFGDVDGVIIIS